MGCEVTDNRLPSVYDKSEDDAVVISRLEAIIPRYFFLIPPTYVTLDFEDDFLLSQLEMNQQVMKAFERIRALIGEI
jgi:hypothetical protein